MVKMIIWVAIGLLALSFFGVSLRALYESPTNQDNLSFIVILSQDGWTLFTHWLAQIPMLFKDLGHISFPK